MTGRSTGVALAVLSATGFGLMPVLTKVVYDDGVGPVGVLSVRFTAAAVLLLVLARIRGERLPTGRPLLQLSLLGGVGYVVESLCYVGALTRISAGLTALLLYLYPAVVVLLSAVLLHHRPGRVEIRCAIAATVGSALTIGAVAAGQTAGVLLGLGAAASYALYIILSSRAAVGVGPLATSAVVMGACGIVYDALAVTTRATLPSSGGAWAALAGVTVLGTERLSAIQLVGGAVVLTAVVVLARTAPVVVEAAEPV